MTRDEIRSRVAQILREVAPEYDPATIDFSTPLREQLDIDSMDLLNMLIAVDRDFGIDIPESDYRHLVTLDSLIEYVAVRSKAV